MHLKHGSLEGAVLSALWTLEENGVYPCSVIEVYNFFIENKKDKKAYTTIKTVMDRLVKKRLLGRYKRGRSYCYRTMHSRVETTAKLIQELADMYLDGNIQQLGSILSQMYNQEEKYLARV